MSLTAWNLPYIINMPSSLEELGGSLDAAQRVEITIYNTSSSLEEVRASLDAAECVEITIYYQYFLFLAGALRIARWRSMRGVYMILPIFSLPWRSSEDRSPTRYFS